jgi:flavorubredoxin
MEHYQRPVKIADGIYWVGTHDPETHLHCNPFLVMGGDRAVIIDPGSRPDFAGVMMKVLQTGIHPRQIAGLILQHYDPDLCGSIPNFLDLCDNPDLRIYSKASNNLFIRYYVDRSRHSHFQDIEEMNMELALGERRLKFIKTPYTHSAGSFVTFDDQTGTLFTSDLFGSLGKHWSLFLTLNDECFTCEDYQNCPKHRDYCPLPDIISFHRHVMPCCRALKVAMQRLRPWDIKTIAPQHGSVINQPRDIAFLMDSLGNLTNVGIDGVPDEETP